MRYQRKGHLDLGSQNGPFCICGTPKGVPAIRTHNTPGSLALLKNQAWVSPTPPPSAARSPRCPPPASPPDVQHPTICRPTSRRPFPSTAQPQPLSTVFASRCNRGDVACFALFFFVTGKGRAGKGGIPCKCQRCFMQSAVLRKEPRPVLFRPHPAPLADLKPPALPHVTAQACTDFSPTAAEPPAPCPPTAPIYSS